MPVRVEWAAPSATVKKVIRNLTAYVKPLQRGNLLSSGKSAAENGWRVYLIHTVTGQVGAQVSPSAGSWEIPLNGTETFSVTLSTQELEGIDRSWYTQWWSGVLITWTRDGYEFPWVAGPTTSWPSETQDSIQLSGGGLREIYKRLVVGTDIRPRNVSLGHIMWLLADAARIKPGGGLNIYDASPDPDGRGHLRNYESWNLQNNGLDKRMSELSAVLNGPDVMFRPEWDNKEHTKIKWGVYHGTSLSARIYSPEVHVFDTTAVGGGLGDVEVRTDASNLVSRVWATGSGDGAGTAITRVEDDSLIKSGFPFLETVLSDTSVGAAEDDTVSVAKANRKFPMALTVGQGRADGPKSGTVRLPVLTGAPIKRWRLHIENRNPALGTDGEARTDRVSMGDLWYSKGIDWTGALREPKKITSLPNIVAGSSDTVSKWVSDVSINDATLSFDYTTDRSPHRLTGGGWHSTKRDSGASSNAGMVREKSLPFHVWVEVETAADVKAVAIYGSSSSAGFAASTPVFDSPLNQWARRAKAIPVHYSVPGDKMLDWYNGDLYKWNQWENLSRSDAVIHYMGSNDVFAGASLTDMQSRFNTVLPYIKDRISSNVYYATIPPRNGVSGGVENVRREYNKWLPVADGGGASGGSDNTIFDFAASISSDDENILPAYNADGIHLNTAGYGKNSGTISINFEQVTAQEVVTTSQLRDMAAGELARRSDGTDQITVSVSARDDKHGLGQWLVGDVARVKVRGWLTIPDGIHSTRIIHASGDFSDMVKIDFQEGVYV